MREIVLMSWTIVYVLPPHRKPSWAAPRSAEVGCTFAVNGKPAVVDVARSQEPQRVKREGQMPILAPQLNQTFLPPLYFYSNQPAESGLQIFPSRSETQGNVFHADTSSRVLLSCCPVHPPRTNPDYWMGLILGPFEAFSLGWLWSSRTEVTSFQLVLRPLSSTLQDEVGEVFARCVLGTVSSQSFWEAPLDSSLIDPN